MREKIKSIMKRVFELNQIDDDISQSSCGNWSSLSSLILVVDLEEEFGIEFAPEDIVEMTSLESIEKKIKEIKNH
jgi:acyl carrier protein